MTASERLRSAFALILTLTMAAGAAARLGAQQPAAAAPLVFDGVTVVDVVSGALLPAQRVVIQGARIQTMGPADKVGLPKRAHVIDAKGKYLIPGLWDLHTHPDRQTDLLYPLYIASGVTGIRNPISPVPLDTLRLWRRDILAGMRVGPVRQILSGPGINEAPVTACPGQAFEGPPTRSVCVDDTARARWVVDSLQAAGSDMIKTYGLGHEMYFAIAAEARRVGMRFGGHIGTSNQQEAAKANALAMLSQLGYAGSSPGPSAVEASDSGASIIDHGGLGLDELCVERESRVEQCRPLAERLRRHNTWWVPTLVATSCRIMTPEEHAASGGLPGTDQTRPTLRAFRTRLDQFKIAFRAGSARRDEWVRELREAQRIARAASQAGADGCLRIAHAVGLPILAGTDDYIGAGFSLHAEVAMYVAEGLTPLEALQSATLHPATMLEATDSLGTVAAGKLADLVLLDGDPLADITNTAAIRAVVANGRYFDRAALDRLAAEAQAAYQRQRQDKKEP